ncbi:hypothetical protein ACVPOW_12615 [Staphylococcus aureus]
MIHMLYYHGIAFESHAQKYYAHS